MILTHRNDIFEKMALISKISKTKKSLVFTIGSMR
jgi:hypothetical protein